MTAAAGDLLAFPDTKARQLARVSMRRLRYWEQVGLVVPSIKRRLGPGSIVRLYSFQDLLALLVVSQLRTERAMPLQRIRKLVSHLRGRNYDQPLRELKFATVGREIYIQHPDGSWEGDLQPEQIVIEQTIRLDPLRAWIERAVKRSDQDTGRIVKLRGVHASAPVFAGTRIRVSTVLDYLRHGRETAEILRAFPDLDEADVEQARRLLTAG